MIIIKTNRDGRMGYDVYIYIVVYSLERLKSLIFAALLVIRTIRAIRVMARDGTLLKRGEARLIIIIIMKIFYYVYFMKKT